MYLFFVSPNKATCSIALANAHCVNMANMRSFSCCSCRLVFCYKLSRFCVLDNRLALRCSNFHFCFCCMMPARAQTAKLFLSTFRHMLTTSMQSNVVCMWQEYQFSCRPVVVLAYFDQSFSSVDCASAMMAIPLICCSYCFRVSFNFSYVFSTNSLCIVFVYHTKYCIVVS